MEEGPRTCSNDGPDEVQNYWRIWQWDVFLTGLDVQLLIESV